MYGKVKEFKNASFAIKVYKFANEMQITQLETQGFAGYFEKNIKASEIFTLFDLYQMTGNRQGILSCKEVKKNVHLI